MGYFEYLTTLLTSEYFAYSGCEYFANSGFEYFANSGCEHFVNSGCKYFDNPGCEYFARQGPRLTLKKSLPSASGSGNLTSHPLNLLLPAQATNDGKVPLPDGLKTVLSKTAA